MKQNKYANTIFILLILVYSFNHLII